MARPRNLSLYVVMALVLGLGLAALFVAGPRLLTTPPEAPPAAPETAAEARKIRARLFYVNEDGTTLSSVEREVMFGEGTVEQARRILDAQLAPPDAPLVSAIPPGTTVRRLFLAGSDAFVDVSPELRSNHPGGATNEMLTVYTIVHALTSNLPAITGVQILVDGREVDTLVGHLDLRRPIEQDPRWVTD